MSIISLDKKDSTRLMMGNEAVALVSLNQVWE